MKIGIMQPYFFPYVGYFSLIKATDKWIVFDEVQFIRKGWINRNCISNYRGDRFYIKVPIVKHQRQTLIKDVKIKVSEKWIQKIFSQLKSYKKRAKNYNKVLRFLEKCLDYKTDSISDLNTYILKETCNYLKIDFNYDVFSKMNINIEKPEKAGDWALNISHSIGAKTYINPIGGVSIFNNDHFIDRNIELKFLKNNLSQYYQGLKTDFIPALSIIDLMMFNNLKDIHKLIDNYCIFNSDAV